MPARPRIPKAIEDKLLVDCKHRCCICGDLWVEIHHIDGNPRNNQEDNLIPLCGQCAKLVHVNFPSAARIHGFSQDQLKLYKKNWIEKCSSITPSMFNELGNLKAEMLELKGVIKKLQERRT